MAGEVGAKGTRGRWRGGVAELALGGECDGGGDGGGGHLVEHLGTQEVIH